MFADEDARYQFEGHRDLTASQPEKMTESPELRAALTYSAGRLKAAHQRHGQALAVLLREDLETRAARLAQLKASGPADQAWRYVRGLVAERLLNPPPELALSPADREARQALLVRLLPTPPAEFARLTAERKVLLLRSALPLMVAERALLGSAVDEATQRFPVVADSLAAANDALNRELKDDQSAQTEIDAARAEYSRLHQAYVRQVEAALGDADRLDDVAQYVRAREPAYRARRSAGRPMREEEGIEAVTDPLGTTPDAIEAPVVS